jgi:hypothetical protein
MTILEVNHKWRETSGADGKLLNSKEAFCYMESVNYKINWVNKFPTKRS